ncbi:Lrp/AsnC ligand binding domain-containing protein, partial [Escherichia coli]|uniref:Lrp/AsnC ligand binding domain-containing protein n=1 Tax=Escherichia coli TaxID=562 RepID=UPI0012C2459B|nr:hypothetical protein [Escherichia coli]
MVEACVLIRTERGRFVEVVHKIKQLKGVKDAYPVLGRFDVVVHVSASDIGADRVMVVLPYYHVPEEE